MCNCQTEIIMRHPTQPLDKEDEITFDRRFKHNAIVGFLLDAGSFDLNQLSLMPFDKEDWIQFYQLIGYTLHEFYKIFPDKEIDK